MLTVPYRYSSARCGFASFQGSRRITSARQYSTPSATGNAQLDAWIAERTSTVQYAHDILDPLRASQIHRTLPIRQPSSLLSRSHGNDVKLDWHEPSDGDPLPNGHHMVYFQPQDWLHELGRDGTSTEYNAPGPYSLRMWAGGSMRWNPDASKRLRVGSSVTQKLSVDRVEMKKDMVFVYQRRDLYPGHLKAEQTGSEDWALSEIRSHVFRQPRLASATPSSTANRRPAIVATSPGDWTYKISYTPSSPLLFRFSALTFNGHKIHYDRDWTREKEGHPDLVVHGPMNAMLLVELASAIAAQDGKTLLGFDYRATSPMYVDKEIRLVAKEGEGPDLVLQAQQGDKVGMTATATFGR